MKLTEAQLKALASRKISKTALAAKLRVSVAHLSRNTPTLPPGKECARRRAVSELFKTRQAYRLKLAGQVEKGRKSLEKAAEEANCSVRTMYRYLCRLKST